MCAPENVFVCGRCLCGSGLAISLGFGLRQSEEETGLCTACLYHWSGVASSARVSPLVALSVMRIYQYIVGLVCTARLRDSLGG